MDAKKTQQAKNIILMTVDCLRADRVGCIGGGTLTPNIDELSKNSLVFRRAFANGPGTNQSFPAILTSTYFLMHGGMRLVPLYRTLAEVLSSNGFATVAFHSNPFLSGVLGWNRGFDEFHDFMRVLKSTSAVVTRSSRTVKLIRLLNKATRVFSNRRIQSHLKRLYYRWKAVTTPYIEGSQLNKHVMNWIDANKESAIFLWMHYMDPHRPYLPHSQFSSPSVSVEEAIDLNMSVDLGIARGKIANDELVKLRELYDCEVRYVDNCIGKLVEFLNTQDLMEDTLLVLCADHGEAFGEHSRFAHAYDMVYNEVLHVPLLMHGLADGSLGVVSDYVQLLDLAPTILGSLGIKKPDSFIGHSIVRTTGENRSGPIYSQSARPDLINVTYDTSKKVISCISGKWKLIINELWGTTELYNIEKDFLEEKNVIKDETGIYNELGSLVQNHLLLYPHKGSEGEFAQTEKGRVKRRLRSLGYV